MIQTLVSFLSSAGWLLVTLGVLVTFHEFGHFLAARAFGVHVLRFSIGFGRSVWARTTRRGMTVAVGWIPLGGYVQMLDSRRDPVPQGFGDLAFDGLKPWKRIVVAAAGPAANVVFALVAFWTMGVLGTPDFEPVLGVPTGLAAEAGFMAGDRIIAVDGRPVPTWSQAVLGLSTDIAAQRDATVEVVESGGKMRTRHLLLSRLVAASNPLNDIGLTLAPSTVPPLVRELRPGLPAAHAGVLAGDRLVSINGEVATTFFEFGEALQRAAAKNPDVDVVVERQGKRLTLHMRAQNEPRQEKPRWVIGVFGPDPHTALLRFGPLGAMGFAWRTTTDTLAMTAQTVGRMVVGRASSEGLSGPVAIAQEAHESANMGVSWFLRFLGFISLGLAFMNLLPIPALDGGHILIDGVEMVRGKPLQERTLAWVHQAGFVVLAGLMSLALWNDMAKILG